MTHSETPSLGCSLCRGPPSWKRAEGRPGPSSIGKVRSPGGLGETVRPRTQHPPAPSRPQMRRKVSREQKGPRSSLLLSPELPGVTVADPMPVHPTQTRPRGWPPIGRDGQNCTPLRSHGYGLAPGPDFPTQVTETQRERPGRLGLTSQPRSSRGPSRASALRPLHTTYLYGGLSPEAPYKRIKAKWPETVSPKWGFGQNAGQVPGLLPAGYFRAAHLLDPCAMGPHLSTQGDGQGQLARW